MTTIHARRRPSWLLAASLSALLVPVTALADEEEHRTHQQQQTRGTGQQMQQPQDRMSQLERDMQRLEQSQRQLERRIEQQMSQQGQLAQGQLAQGACPQQQAIQQRGAQLRQVSGEILRTKQVTLQGTSQRSIVALIDTQRGNERLVVDLGPAEGVRNLQLRQGDRIAAEGRVTRIGDRQVLFATRVRSGQQTANIDRSQQQQHFTQMMQQHRQQQRAQVQQSQMDAEPFQEPGFDQEMDVDVGAQAGLGDVEGEVGAGDEGAQARIDIEADEELID